MEFRTSHLLLALCCTYLKIPIVRLTLTAPKDDFEVVCSAGQLIGEFTAVFDAGQKDQKFGISCQNTSAAEPELYLLEWSDGYSPTEMVEEFTCPDGWALAGINSEYLNAIEMRVQKYTCSLMRGETRDCIKDVEWGLFKDTILADNEVIVAIHMIEDVISQKVMKYKVVKCAWFDDCNPDPCVNGFCEDLEGEGKYVCHCYRSYGGESCEVQRQAEQQFSCDMIGGPQALIDGANYKVADSAFTATSMLSSGYAPAHSRLNLCDSQSVNWHCGWQAKYDRLQEWIQVDLGEEFLIKKVETQSEGRNAHYVKSYKLRTSFDGTIFTDADGGRTFVGNTNSNDVAEETLDDFTVGKYVRLYPQTWEGKIALRWEVYGCPVFDMGPAYPEWQPGDRLGCFGFTSRHFSTRSRHKPFVMIPATSGQAWNSMNCTRECSYLETYTYAGIEVRNTKYCICLNNLKDMIKVDDEECRCSHCTHTYKTMVVYGTCPNGYFHPPVCTTRAKSSCVMPKALTTAQYNGMCEECVLGPGETGHTRCEVFSSNEFTVSLAFLNTEHALAKQEYDEAWLDHGTGVDAEGVGVPPHTVERMYPTIRSAESVYLHKAKAILLAPGATYLSVWHLAEPDAATANEFTVELDWKFLMNTEIDFTTQEYVNLDYRIANEQLEYFLIGYHTVDTAEPLGDASRATRMEHTGIAAKKDTDDRRINGVNYAVFRNRYELDHYGQKAWVPGKQVTTTTTWGNYDDDHPLLDTEKHSLYVPLKAFLKTACSSNCKRSTCDEKFHCKYGCIAGFLGPHCTTKCPVGMYGEACLKDCTDHCNSQSCSPTTGMCTDGCSPGYIGWLCRDPCPIGSFGTNCKGECSEDCLKGKLGCSIIDGKCHGGCKLGYEPPLCVEECPPYTWGKDCVKTCGHCADNDTCNVLNGTCEGGCHEMYMDPMCTCSKGTYGFNCSMTCGHCKAERPCDVTHGECPGSGPPGKRPGPGDNPGDVCEDDHQPPMCVCKLNTYGEDCSKSCGNCINGFCHAEDGYCVLGCAPGYQGKTCTTSCEAGSWGMNCTEQCAACLEPCNHMTGACKDGKCIDYFQGPDCVDCQPGWCGPLCKTPCGHCAYGTPCERDCICPPQNITLPPVLDPIVRAAIAPPIVDEVIDEFIEEEDLTGNSTQGNIVFDEGILEITLTPKSCDDIPTTAKALMDCMQTGVFTGKMITSDQDDEIEDLVNSACVTSYQAPYCKCGAGFFGENCDGSCQNCLGGCLNTGRCVAGCKTGWMGKHCDIPCPPTHFGPNCQFRCGHCFNGSRCTSRDGLCTEGCDPGYMLPTCRCQEGYFGSDCERECGNCKEGTTCSFVDGACPDGCKPGYLEPYCNCSVGKYGINCDQACGHCGSNTPCHVFTGVCPKDTGCQPGYKMPYCKEKCDAHTYGMDCVSKCGHCSGCGSCHWVSGICLNEECDPGFVPPMCTRTCLPGVYGSSCGQSCGNCYNKAMCDIEDGMCDTGCELGYLSPMCHEPCPDGKWGFNCQDDCGNCKNDEPCNKYFGHCENGCKGDYVGPLCDRTLADVGGRTTCPEGFYNPEYCLTPCGRCMDEEPCEGVSGFCVNGCERGFLPPLCHSPCPTGRYGSNCIELCGNCKGNEICDTSTGKCPSGCEEKWFGSTCKYPTQEDYEQAQQEQASAGVASSPRHTATSFIAAHVITVILCYFHLFVRTC